MKCDVTYKLMLYINNQSEKFMWFRKNSHKPSQDLTDHQNTKVDSLFVINNFFL